MVIFAEAETSLPSATLDLVRLSNGVTLHYAHQGPSSGPAVVMLHGFTDSWFSFSRVLPLLPADLRVIAPDRRTWRFKRPITGYRVLGLCRRRSKVMYALRCQSGLVGHSRADCGAQSPRALSRRACRGGAVAWLAAEEARDGRDGRGRQCSPIRDDENSGRSTQHDPHPRPRSHGMVIANSRRTPARVWKAALQACRRPDQASRPEVRALVVGGREDSGFSRPTDGAPPRQFRAASYSCLTASASLPGRCRKSFVAR